MKAVDSMIERMRAIFRGKRLWNAASGILQEWLFHYRFVHGALAVILAVILVLFVTVMFGDNQKWIGGLLGLENKNEILTFLGFGIGGILAVLSVLASHRRAEAMADSAHEQAKTNEHVEQGHRQERFKIAVEHLGHESSSVRLGGAYELIHLARDDEIFREAALKMLCAHIRVTTKQQGYDEKYKDVPSEEIQTLLTLLFQEQSDIFKKFSADLRSSYLSGACIEHAHLGNVNFEGACLWNAYLEYSDMRGSCFMHADLRRAHLYSTDMKGSTLAWAKLEDAGFVGSQLQGVALGMAEFDKAAFAGAQLQGATYERAPSRDTDWNVDSLKSMGKLSDRIDFARSNKHTAVFQRAIEGSVDIDTGAEIVDFFKRSSMTKGIEDVESHLQKFGISIGAYTKEEADKWIAEYNEDYG